MHRSGIRARSVLSPHVGLAAVFGHGKSLTPLPLEPESFHPSVDVFPV